MNWMKCSECKKCGMPIYHKEKMDGEFPTIKKTCSCGPEVIIREYPWSTPIYPTYKFSDTVTETNDLVTMGYITDA